MILLIIFLLLAKLKGGKGTSWYELDKINVSRKWEEKDDDRQNKILPMYRKVPQRIKIWTRPKLAA